MASPLTQALEDELVAQGIRVDDLEEGDYRVAQQAFRSLVTRIKAKQTWENHVGELLTHQQVLALTGWSKQALSQAVREHRLLRLTTGRGSHVYPLSTLDNEDPARPLSYARQILSVWVAVDPQGWAAASWLVSAQPELSGRTPRSLLLEGNDLATVVALARQATQRLAA